jgi:glyoxylase-like metal-dependent hydrolase (beta-lactamase superfamily II)
VFAGDTLFFGSIGRTDLPGGDFHRMMKSIKERLLTLDDDTLVWPGHGPKTTIGHERRTNPFIQDL